MTYTPKTEAITIIDTYGKHLCTIQDQMEMLPIVDIRSEMREQIEILCHTHGHYSAMQMARQVFDAAEAKYNGK